jgi:hypothetical protein
MASFMVYQWQVKLKFSVFLTKYRAMMAYGGVGMWLETSLTSAVHGGEWSVARPGLFIPGERAPGTHWRGVWVGPRFGLDAVAKRKVPTPTGKRTPVVQPVAYPLYSINL